MEPHAGPVSGMGTVSAQPQQLVLFLPTSCLPLTCPSRCIACRKEPAFQRYQLGFFQPNRRNRQDLRDNPTLTVRMHTKPKLYNHNVCCEPNTDCFWLHDSHFSLCETPYDPCLNDSSGSSFAVSSTHLVLRILFPSLPQDSPSSKEKT